VAGRAIALTDGGVGESAVNNQCLRRAGWRALVPVDATEYSHHCPSGKQLQQQQTQQPTAD